MTDLRTTSGNPEWGGAGGRTFGSRVAKYLPLLGFVLAAAGGLLLLAYLVSGRGFVGFVLYYSCRWNMFWTVLSALVLYLIACEITSTNWFRRFGIEMPQERLQGLALALVLGSFGLVVPFRIAWTNYWLSRDGRQVRAVVTAEGAALGYRYRINGNEYRACCYKVGRGMAPEESITVYYSASHPSVSEVRRPVSMADGAWEVRVLLGLPFEFMAIATVVSPRGKWAYRFGSRNILPPPTHPVRVFKPH